MTSDGFDAGLYLAWIGEDIMTLPCIEARFGYFIRRGGKIVMTWNQWWSRYVFWQAPGVCEIFRKIFRKICIRRFRGQNRGRHWDRKRKE